MSGSGNQSKQKKIQYREVKLKGSKTQKTRSLIILDEDEQGENERIQSFYALNKARVAKKMEQKIEQKVQQKITRMSTLKCTLKRVESEKSVEQLDKRQVQGVNQSNSNRRSTKISPNRPNTRSSVCNSQRHYTKQNYAKIPRIFDYNSEAYKKFLVAKCVSLSNREYMMLN